MSNSFTVAPGYNLIMAHNQDSMNDFVMQQTFRHFWNSIVPTKVPVFSWRLILDRLLTRVQLLKRGVEI